MLARWLLSNLVTNVIKEMRKCLRKYLSHLEISLHLSEDSEQTLQLAKCNKNMQISVLIDNSTNGMKIKWKKFRRILNYA